MTEKPLTLLIIGADGATGREALSEARARGHQVRATWFGPKENRPEAQEGVQWQRANVLEDDLTGLVRGADAVLSCIGVGNDPQTLISPPPLYTDGTAAICDAMQNAGVRRFVAISATFVEVKNRGPVWFRLPAMVALDKVFDQMARMEALLRQREEIDWTAVRPGWLMDGPATRDYVVSADVIPPDLIRTRHADLADFMVSLAETGDWLRQTPAIARAEPDEASSPSEVVREFVG